MLRGTWVAVLVLSALALGQNPAQPAPQNGNTPGAAGSTSATPRVRFNPDGSGAGMPGDSPRGQNMQQALFGRVVLSDGADFAGGAMVQRVCGLAVAGETYTDSQGRFNLQQSSNLQQGIKDSLSADSAASSGANAGGCELRASLSGYQTESVSLGSRRASDNNVGVIVLRRRGDARGMTISATTLLAPKEARRLYDQGMDAAHRHQPDRAQKDFANAVRIYPRYAAAWLELGKIFEQRDHLSQARDAYGAAIAADHEYLFPYQRLYLLDIRESKWQEAVDATNKVLRLNPYEFSEAFYFNAVANLALNNLDAAERSARGAGKLEGAQAEPRANYLLGVIQWRRGDLAGAADRLRAFLADSIEGPERTSAQKMVADIERQGRAAQGRSGLR